MPRKRKLDIKLDAKEEALVHYEMEWGRNDQIKRQAKVLYFANQGAKTITELCQKTGHDPKTVNRIIALYYEEGVNAIYQCKRGKRINHLEKISDELEAYFDDNPPTNVPDAVRKIRENFQINITQTPVRIWLKKRGFHAKSQKAYRQKQI